MTRMPLEGLRVIDLGQVWAGPVLGQFFADFGAEVIRVDTMRRQGMQSGAAKPVTDPTNPLSFQVFGRNKLSITLDLTNPQGRELFKELVKVSDIVFENFSPRVMKEFGLDFEALSKENPRLVMASLSAAGQYGPWQDIITYGPSLTALYGVKSHLGYHGESRLQEDIADFDPTAATYAFFSILASLRFRERTGEGQYIDLAQGEAGVCSFAESFLECAMNGRVPGTQGNRYPGMAPHGIYRCDGEDKWISIAVKTQAEWEGFCKALGNPAWTGDERFADHYGRLTHQDELDSLIAEWTGQRPPMEVTTLLQAHGVAAFPAFDGDDLFLDPHCEHRRSIVRVEHPDFSARDALYGIPWKLGDTPGAIRRPNPAIGAHNRYVFGELLGLTDSQIEKLIEEKVLY